MSEENVEIVRRFAECWERGDWDGMKELTGTDVEMRSTVGGVDLRVAEAPLSDRERS